MGRPEINAIVAKNLELFIERQKTNPHALSKVAKVASNTIENYLHPKKRYVTGKSGVGYPNLDKLDKIAGALGLQVWEVLHPDIEQSLRERETYVVVRNAVQAEPLRIVEPPPEEPYIPITKSDKSSVPRRRRTAK